MPQLIGLAEAISALREEITGAATAGAAETLKFEVGPIELNLEMVVEKEAKAGAKVKFSIFGWGGDATAEGKVSDSRTIKVKLTLTPSGLGGSTGKTLVGDKEPAADQE